MPTTTNYGWTTPADTDLVKDGASAIRTLGTAIDTTVFNNASAGIAKTIVDAKGDIIAATAADTVSRLAVGANDTVLTADSSTATGLKWAAPSSGAMTLITRNSFSAVSSLTIDNLFSDTYENYLMTFSYSGTDGGSVIAVRGRYGSTTYTGSDYHTAFNGVYSNGTQTNLVYDSISYWGINIIQQTTDVPSLSALNFYRSSGSKQLVFSGTGLDNRNNRGLGGGGILKNSQTWTGLYIFPGSGTITGTFSMYGLVTA